MANLTSGNACLGFAALANIDAAAYGIIERNGIALFHWNRGVILEDRFTDRVEEATAQLESFTGATVYGATRLMRSVPPDGPCYNDL